MFWRKKKRAAKAVAFDETLECHNSALSQLRNKATELAEAVEDRRRLQKSLDAEFSESIKTIEG